MSQSDPTSALVLSDHQVKHLELIQAIITRLGNGSFLIKGWTLTVAGFFFGFLSKGLNWKMTLTGFIPIIGFWLLDGYFLRQERLFRKLYDAVRVPSSAIEPFAMSVHLYHSSVPWWAVVRSHTLRNFYGMLVLVNLIFLAGGIIKVTR
ncbi:hypothetical protein [Streptomyces sp. enrichment culture]|uniref:hypothetical protein n=1 Tax=Streptomyces sp. enrichment culture TaxID=1795815 RepID=UPI003F56AB6F